MKKTLKALCLAALVVSGAVQVSCGKQEIEVNLPQEVKIETLSVTVGFGEDAGTRALTSGGVKTFAAGETMALVYNNGTSTVKAVSHTLTSDDLINGGRSANFTFEVEAPDKTQNVTYVYPAAMANSDGSINYPALATQDGTLATLAGNLDLATYTGAWNGDDLPANVELENQLAILALTLKNSDGSSIITGGLNQVKVSDGTNDYTAAPASGTFSENVIYVAIRPVTTAAYLQLSATDGVNNYVKSASSRTYAAGTFNSLALRMFKPTPADLFTNGLKVGVTVRTRNSNTGTVSGTYSSDFFYFNNVSTTGVATNASMFQDGNNLVVEMNNAYNSTTIMIDTEHNTCIDIPATGTGSEWELHYLEAVTINGVDITGQLDISWNAVTWNFSELSEDESPDLEGGYTYKGITVTGDGYLNFTYGNLDLNAEQTLTFTSSFGRNFQSIVVNTTRYASVYGDGWDDACNWSGDASSVTIGEHSNAEGITSIVFYFQD